MSGDLAKAKEQLAWLQSRNSEEAPELAESIEAAEKGGAAPGGSVEGDKEKGSGEGSGEKSEGK